MAELKRADQPFRFYTRLNLTELTGLRATTLVQLVKFLKDVPGSSVYHHTHRFLQQHQHLSPEPPNDFAYWVTDVLGEDELGEKLASIDTIQFASLRGLRDKIIQTIEEYLRENKMAELRFAHQGEEFHFLKSISFIIPTSNVAYDLREFVAILEKITIDSIYFHIFEARLRLEKPTNDFSYWFADSLGEKKLADELARLDPYTFTMEDLRRTIVSMIRKKTG